MNSRKEIIYANSVNGIVGNLLVCVLIYLNNDDRISAYAWSENGYGFLLERSENGCGKWHFFCLK